MNTRTLIDHGIVAEIQKMQTHSSGFFAAIQKMQDQFRSSGVVAEIQKMQALSSGVVADIQKMQDQFRSSGVVAEIQKMQALSSGFFAATQKMQANSASSVITRLAEMAENLHSVDCTINSDGTITGQNRFFNQIEVQRIIESTIETTLTDDKISFEIAINNILNNIEKQHPVITKFFVHILWPIIVGIFIAMFISQPVKIDYDQLSKHLKPVQIDYGQLSKHLKKKIHQIEIGDEFYRHYRFVSARSINVRSKNSKQSRYVGKLYFGYLVKIVDKKKNWSLIEYKSNDEDVIIQGWVFTRYIKRFD